ncbi:MAG: HupE/UreJ family protein [Saprospiraceae bacterium]|nr:HupE/UreJ family protein [Saprospiraceae bacterium]
MKKYPLSIAIILCAATAISAHTVNYALEGQPTSHVFSYYLSLGFQHILPDGLDHILFIVGLYLLSPRLKDVLWQATAFTVAHTVTLILSMKNIIVAPPALIEPIIALSIAFIAIENVLSMRLKSSRLAIVFLFGLVHGLGFASALNELGLPRDAFFSSLLSFNMGVELGQITVILGCWLAFGRWFSHEVWYKKRVVMPISMVIATVALVWTFERML